MPPFQTKSTGTANTSAVLPVREVVDIMREWVELHARHEPDFAGAYTWGGITAMPADAPFALYRDVDVVIVTDADVPDDDAPGEVLYRGLMLEVIRIALDDHRDAEVVLANPSRAPNIAATQILADPLGILAPLQQAVVAQYTKGRWIRARCEAEKADARSYLSAMREASDPYDRINGVWLLLNALSGLLAVARLRRPTTRRTLSLLGELLLEQRRPDVYEAALKLWGSAEMQRSEVEALLSRSAAAFDRAVEVYTTPTAFGFTLRPHLRPYGIEASQAMIDEGQHREAMFWIWANSEESYRALLNDAPEVEQPAFAAEQDALRAALGYTALAEPTARPGPPEAYTRRIDEAERLMHDIFRIADEIVAKLPE